MDLLYLAYYLSLFVTPLIFFLVAFRKRKSSAYSQPSWYYVFKKLLAKVSVKRHQEELEFCLKYVPEIQVELPRDNPTKYESDSYVIYAADNNGNYLSMVLGFRHTLHMDVSIEFRRNCGKIYKLPNEPLIQTYSVNSRRWKAGGLNVEVVNPLRRLRITYNGLMRCVPNTGGKGELEYVRFNFLWNAASEPIFHPYDVHDDLLTDSIAREPWRNGEWIQMLGKDCGFEQYGVLQGFFQEETLLYMPSWRRRRWGPSDVLALKRDFNVFGTARDGTVFCVGARSLRIGATQLRYGTVLLSNGVVKSISGSDVSLEQLADNMEVPNVFTLHFEVDGRTFKCVSHMNTGKTSVTVNDEERGWIAKTTNVEIDVNSEQARGIAHFWYRRFGAGRIALPEPLLLPRKAENPEDILVASLTSLECLDLELTGGKGNSLGLLTSIEPADFVVPPGFVVTSTTFRRHLEKNPQLVESIRNLQDVCYGIVEGVPEEVCKRTVELFGSVPIEESISTIIENEINTLKSEETYDWGWAVRSSGIGEDSDELSAAGQNSTFLGCGTTEEVLKGIAACWGSLFTFQSVEYRRQHGLPIQCDIAVVVQKMIPSDCSGVLFTSHPTTGDPSQMVITSNYGLGESVVSGSVDPDTITLAKSIKGNVKILGSTVGAKRTKIILGTSEEKTEERAVEVELANELSLSEEQALKLGRLGVFLEGRFGNPRDIEWAFYKGELYLLQSRPITTLNRWTDWELEHEFDTPVMSQSSLYTRGNVEEVIKGAVTPLSQSFTMQSLDLAMQVATNKGNCTNYHRKGVVITSHAIFMDVINMTLKSVGKEITLANTVTDLAVFGHKVLDKNLLKTALGRHGAMGAKQKLQLILEQLDKIVNNKSTIEKALELKDNWKIRIKDFESPQAILDKIDFNRQALQVAFGYHADTSRTSIIYQMIAMIILAEKHKEFNNDHYHDIGLLLAGNDEVESAQVPVILERISSEIRKQNLAEDFSKIKPEDGMSWLSEHLPKCKERLDGFFRVHGHRSLREFELFAKSWDMEPETIISMIQSNCKAEPTTKKAVSLSPSETVSKLKSPKSKITRKILKFMVKKCRVAVAGRETTKSIVIKIIHRFRLAFNELGVRMVKDGFIPHKDLVFFFTVEELRSHLKERDPVLVSKAVRRRKLYEKWNSYQFPEFSLGVPVPKQESSGETGTVRIEDGVRVMGTPVCNGEVVGRACVITDIKDINQIEPGDILITISTDIAWSPYFPILSGVVTEIGGLISHGAVVAREYGLPCIVRAQGATKTFKTGDKVLLDGKSGVIGLVQ